MYKYYKSINNFSEENILVTELVLFWIMCLSVIKWDTYNEEKIVNLYPCCWSFTTISSLRKKRKLSESWKIFRMHEKKIFSKNISVLYVKLSALKKQSRAARNYTEKKIDTKFCSLG